MPFRIILSLRDIIFIFYIRNYNICLIVRLVAYATQSNKQINYLFIHFHTVIYFLIQFIFQRRHFPLLFDDLQFYSYYDFSLYGWEELVVCLNIQFQYLYFCCYVWASVKDCISIPFLHFHYLLLFKFASSL